MSETFPGQEQEPRRYIGESAALSFPVRVDLAETEADETSPAPTNVLAAQKFGDGHLTPSSETDNKD